jgi:hypothetical protein
MVRFSRSGLISRAISFGPPEEPSRQGSWASVLAP